MTEVSETNPTNVKVLQRTGKAEPIADSDSSHEPTKALAAAYQKSLADKRMQLENRPLLTRAQREQDEKRKESERLKKYPSTTIRVEFPNGIMLQATFPSDAKVQAIYDFTKSALCKPDHDFMLVMPPRNRLDQHDITLVKAGLSPSARTLFTWTEAEMRQDKGQLLKEEYQSMATPLGTSSAASNSDANKSESKSKPSSSSQPKSGDHKPKWLKKIFKQKS